MCLPCVVVTPLLKAVAKSTSTDEKALLVPAV